MAARTDLDPIVVERTGLALLHEGELVVPASGSEALFRALDGDGTLVLQFPIEVEVRIVPTCDPDEHADTTLRRFVQAMDGIA
jgi:hypothetical protein